jgi:Carbohydrate-selective porin, OprB family/S-layer homology domain
MSKMIWNVVKLSPAVLGAAILAANGAIAAETLETKLGEAETSTNIRSEALATQSQTVAQAMPSESAQPSNTLEQINQYSGELGNQNNAGQVTSVSQLTDVDPTHWAFQALQSLVERYGCIEGYPDRTYRGNRALTRYEFAAGLNSCLDRIQELIAAAVADLPSKEDIATIRRLQEEFAAELATLRGRVDALEARTARLEAQQFSTTTKLRGEVIFALSGAFGDDKAVPSPRDPVDSNVEDNVIFSNRARLNFDTSFSGRDRLRTRLQARNTTPFGTAVTGTNMSRLAFDGNDENDILLSKLEYRFPVGSSTTVTIIATGGEFNDNFFTYNPLLESSGSGAISRFGRFNPIYRQSDGGAGLTISHSFSKAFGLDLGYMVPANVVNNPNEGFGLIDGNYSAIAQLNIRPSQAFNFGVAYVRSYYNNEGDVNLTASTGSGFAQRPFGRVATNANHFGAQASFRFGQNFTLSGWYGYTQAFQESGGDNEATLQNWAATLGISDFGKKGNLLGFIFGMPPKATDNDINAREDQDTSYHAEALYRIQVSDSISITPGVIWLINPEHNENNDDIFVGTIRTTFSF